MAVPSSVSADATYATKVNLRFPDSQAQATAAEVRAAARMNDALPAGVAVTVAAGTIKVAT